MNTRALVLTSTLIVASVAPAHAAGNDAKAHFEAGAALVESHDFAAAIGEFEHSYQLNPVPEALFDIALCQRALGRSAEAIETLRRYVAEASSSGKLDASRKQETDDLLRALQAKVDSSDAHVQEVAPPPVVVTAPSATALTPPPVTPPAVMRGGHESHPLAVLDTAEGRVALGLGIGALVLVSAAATTGSIVLSEKSTYDASCNTICDASLYSQAHTLAITTDVVFGVSAATAIVSLVLFLARPRHRDLRVEAHGLSWQLQGEF